MKFALTTVSNKEILAVVCTALILAAGCSPGGNDSSREGDNASVVPQTKIAETVVPASLSATINCQVARFAELASPLQYSYRQNKSKRYVR